MKLKGIGVFAVFLLEPKSPGPNFDIHKAAHAMKTILITGAGGYIGTELIKRLSLCPQPLRIIAVDLRAQPAALQLDGITYLQADIREAALQDIILEHRPQSVVHLASVVGAGGDVDLDYSIDVLGTENVLKACERASVKQLIVTSSGAAYGYHADNPSWLRETNALRGNNSFAYSRHKRLVEESLARYRESCPSLKQLVLRPGTILGATTNNQITALFDKPFVLNIAGSSSAFVFMWDADVIAIIEKGILEGKEGIYNLAGDGALNSAEIARILKKRRLTLPAWLLGGLLSMFRFLRLGKLGAEHVKFIQFRPVLDNTALKEDFGYIPQKTSLETFEYFLEARQKPKPKQGSS